jgi:RES domain-containing protein
LRAIFRAWEGLAYRAHDPRWAFDPISGEGARLKGGRFNRPGTPALYLALRVEGAMREAQAGFPYRFQPMTVCAYEVRVARLADATDDTVLAELGITPADLACPWRLDVAEGRVARSWELADTLLGCGAQGLLYPSMTLGAVPGDVNLVLWHWQDPGAEVRVIDDERRLPSNPAPRAGRRPSRLSAG